MMNRREVILAGVAAIAAPALPAIPIAPPAAAAFVPPLPVWMVGTPGEFDWQAIRAMTEHEARMAWVCEKVGTDECENGAEPTPECDCEFCCELSGVEVERKPALDAIADITPGDWLRNGMGHICSRCGYETFDEEGGHAIGDEAVCADCMTLADWDIADPERAAEMRAELAEEAAEDARAAHNIHN
jgi:hypothetical protein